MNSKEFLSYPAWIAHLVAHGLGDCYKKEYLYLEVGWEFNKYQYIYPSVLRWSGNARSWNKLFLMGDAYWCLHTGLDSDTMGTMVNQCHIFIWLWPIYTNFYYLNRVKTQLLYLKTRLIYFIFVLIFDSVFDSIFDSGSSNSTSIHQFYYSASTRLRSSTFTIRLDDESWVGPWYLMCIHMHVVHPGLGRELNLSLPERYPRVPTPTPCHIHIWGGKY